MKNEQNTRLSELIAAISEHFDEAYYLNVNQDVAASGVDAFGHYLMSGMTEGRAPNAQISGSDMISIVSTKLGRLPERSELNEAYKLHSSTSTLKGRLKSIARKSLKGFRTSKDHQTKTSPNVDVENDADSRGWANTMLLEEETHLKEVEEAPAPAKISKPIDPKFTAVAGLMNLAAFNMLGKKRCYFQTKSDALTYLLHDGADQLHPLDFHLVPDPDFYRSLYPDTETMSDVSLYKDWLHSGIGGGRFISEAHMLRHFGIQASTAIDDFDHDGYLESYTDLPATWNAAQSLLHFLRSGLAEGRFDFEISDQFFRSIEDAIVQLNRQDPAKALAVIEKLELLGRSSLQLNLIMAEHYKNLGRYFGANRLLDRKSSEIPIEQFWLEYHRSDILKRSGMLDEATIHLERAAFLEDDSIWVEGEVEKLLQSRFDNCRHKAKRLADTGRVDQGREILDAIIQDTYQALKPYGWNESDGATYQPKPALGKRPLRIGFLADLFLPQCRLYRVDQKIEQLEEAGFEVELFDFRKDCGKAYEQVGLFDIWLVYRAPAFFDVLKVIRAANDLGRPTVYEIDDLLIDPAHFPEPLSAYDKSLSKEEHAGLALATSYNGGVARLCQFGLASTPCLARELAKLVRSGKAFTHRNALGSAHMQGIKTADAREASRPRRKSVRIFYGSGTKAHKDFLQDTFFSAVQEVMERHKNVEFVALGHVDAPALQAKFDKRCILAAPEWDIQKYWEMLSEADINVAVLKKSLLTDCKSEIKWLEAAMLGIPSVVSKTSTMEGVVVDGETGLLAETHQDWVDKLSSLVESEKTRKQISHQARETVLYRYSLPVMASSLKEIFDNIITFTEQSVGS